MNRRLMNELHTYWEEYENTGKINTNILTFNNGNWDFCRALDWHITDEDLDNLNDSINNLIIDKETIIGGNFITTNGNWILNKVLGIADARGTSSQTINEVGMARVSDMASQRIGLVVTDALCYNDGYQEINDVNDDAICYDKGKQEIKRVMGSAISRNNSLQELGIVNDEASSMDNSTQMIVRVGGSATSSGQSRQNITIIDGVSESKESAFQEIFITKTAISKHNSKQIIEIIYEDACAYDESNQVIACLFGNAMKNQNATQIIHNIDEQPFLDKIKKTKKNY